MNRIASSIVRGHRFVRYADDCNIYVRSEKAGRRVMASLTRFIEGRLKLQINAEKSAVARPWQRSFLGFTVKDDPLFRRCIADKAVARFKRRVRALTGRHRGVSLERMIGKLVPTEAIVDPPSRGSRLDADHPENGVG
jgi:RNA-directed DNA polymerase